MDNILTIDKIEKYYGSKSSLTKAIDGISFEVEKGEFLGIMGASGSGKTTLLNVLSTIDVPTSGDISMENGFPNNKAFSKAFYKKYGIMPAEFRKRQKSAINEISN